MFEVISFQSLGVMTKKADLSIMTKTRERKKEAKNKKMKKKGKEGGLKEVLWALYEYISHSVIDEEQHNLVQTEESGE